MSKPIICKECGNGCDELCTPLKKLIDIYNEQRLEDKRQLIKNLRKELSLFDCEVDSQLESLGIAVINKMPELYYINDFNIKVGYVRSYEAKKDNGKSVFADCRKVNKTYSAYLPFDFVITFYDPNVSHMNNNQIKILMLHELKHIGIGEKGLKIEDHDVEDFISILTRYGIRWNEFNNNDVPDILLAGGDDVRDKESKAKKEAQKNGRKRKKVDSK